MFPSKPIARDLLMAFMWLVVFLACMAAGGGFVLRLLDILPWLLHGNP